MKYWAILLFTSYYYYFTIYGTVPPQSWIPFVVLCIVLELFIFPVHLGSHMLQWVWRGKNHTEHSLRTQSNQRGKKPENPLSTGTHPSLLLECAHWDWLPPTAIRWWPWALRPWAKMDAPSLRLSPEYWDGKHASLCLIHGLIISIEFKISAICV